MNCQVSSVQKTTKRFISILQSCGIFSLLCTVVRGGHILLALRGRHPLCGTGVSSVIDTTSRPPIVRPLIADCTTDNDTEKANFWLFVIKTEIINITNHLGEFIAQHWITHCKHDPFAHLTSRTKTFDDNADKCYSFRCGLLQTGTDNM